VPWRPTASWTPRVRSSCWRRRERWDRKGQSINNPEQNHHLQHYRGGTNVSALQVVCILYVGVQLLLPGQDAGIDFAREYELARGLAGEDP